MKKPLTDTGVLRQRAVSATWAVTGLCYEEFRYDAFPQAVRRGKGISHFLPNHCLSPRRRLGGIACRRSISVCPCRSGLLTRPPGHARLPGIGCQWRYVHQV